MYCIIGIYITFNPTQAVPNAAHADATRLTALLLNTFHPVTLIHVALARPASSVNHIGDLPHEHLFVSGL